MDTSKLEAAITATPPNRAASYILECLQKNDIRGARMEYEHDGDKLSNPMVLKEIVALLGCRTHGKKNCKNWICKSVPKT
jgi:hypothetical protein